MTPAEAIADIHAFIESAKAITPGVISDLAKRPLPLAKASGSDRFVDAPTIRSLDPAFITEAFDGLSPAVHFIWKTKLKPVLVEHWREIPTNQQPFISHPVSVFPKVTLNAVHDEVGICRKVVES